MIARARAYLEAPVSIAPLASFRVLFGAMMVVGVLRFVLNGWVDEFYVQPRLYFGYWGLEWLKPVGAAGMYTIFAFMGLSAMGIALGAFYRISSFLFFATFTFVELLDKSNYLNHYYFVSLVAFLLMWVPAHARYSVDVLRRPGLRREMVPRWNVGIFRLQMGIVYFFAGLAKLNADWLFSAQPLRIWLPAQSHLPLIGGLLAQKWVAFAFSWFGAAYDLTVPFFLLLKRTRPYAFAAVLAFHLMTALLFQIGLFPYVMIAGSCVFFSGAVHERVWKWAGKRMAGNQKEPGRQPELAKVNKPGKTMALAGLVLFFGIQALLPFRYLLYPGNVFWTEQGYRFSWRVMLMEKAGHATFRVRDPRTGGESEIMNRDYLTPNQEKMMSTQPDMLLQYAHFLEQEYRAKGIPDPEVHADVFVTLNGRGSRRFIDPACDLSKVSEGFGHKDWVLPLEKGSFAHR